MKKLDLTKIGFFNPGRLNDEEIERSFVTRISLFEYIFKKIISEKERSIPQHHLVIGQRGMGKTSLLMRIAVELRKQPNDEKFIALTFPEEQYNIDRLSKFWLNCLDALADALDRENRPELAQRLDTEIQKNASQQNRDAYALFEKWIKEIGRRPVLLVDNLGLIFSKISIEDQHQLRAILMSPNAPVLVGASSVSLEEVLDYGAPFYDSFQIQTLKKLTLDESIEVLKNLAQITGYGDFENQLHKNRGRLGAIYQLTGGTPRTVAMLFPLVRDGFSEEIQTDLDALMDLITPLYKARFEELSDQLQVVLDAVALHWDPINLEQLRTATHLENNQLSPQLKRLVEIGWLQKLDAYKAKGSAYEISERFFNVWYLMRRSSRRQKRELYCLSRFLELYFGEEVEKIAHNRLGTKSVSSDQIAFDLALAEILKDPNVQKQLQDKTYKELFELGTSNPGIFSNFSIPDEETRKWAGRIHERLINLYDSKLFDKVHEMVRILSSIPQIKNYLYHEHLSLISKDIGQYELAIKCINKAISLNPSSERLYNLKGILYQDYLKDLGLAEATFLEGLRHQPENKYLLSNLVFLYRDAMNRISDSKKIFESSDIDEELKDTYFLNKALFAYYDQNAGIAKEWIEKALDQIKDRLPNNTQDDWWRSGAVAVKLGFGSHFLGVLKEHGFDTILRPYYVAIQALMEKNPESFLISIAAEVREPARQIMNWMKRYNE